MWNRQAIILITGYLGEEEMKTAKKPKNPVFTL